MKKNRMINRIAGILCVAVGVTAVAAPLTACHHDNKLSNENSPLVLATDVLDGVFNPFFYTSGSDGEVVGQTQIGMLSGDSSGKPASGWDEPCVALAHSSVTNGDRSMIKGDDYGDYWTEYYFAVKDNIKFSDGVDLTMHDVLFNIYMYLDPAYTGSSTMYSVKIKGLKEYRTQSVDTTTAGSVESYFDSIADARLNQIKSWTNNRKENDWNEITDYEYYLKEDPTIKTIENDINKIHEFFREELETNWNSAMGIDVEKDYEKYVDKDGNRIFTDNWQVFLYNYGAWQIQRIPGRTENDPAYYELINDSGLKNKSNSEAHKKELVDYVFSSMLGEREKATKKYKENLRSVMTYYATASRIFQYVRSDVIERELAGEMAFKTVTGITTERMSSIPDGKGGNITLKDKDGNPQSYDVLKIKIDGVDPKAIQNFSFTVAPGHYYATDWNKALAYDYNKPESEDNVPYFGVKYSSSGEMNRIRQIHVPLGAGAYRATTENGSSSTDKIEKSQFFSSNVVYMERNEHFLLGTPKIKKLRFKVIKGNLLYDSVVNKEVHYATPNMEKDTIGKLEGASDMSYVSSENLGYGYIGVSAQFIHDIDIRRAIMVTFNPQMCVDYYGGPEYASVITRPMSKTLEDYYPKDKDMYYASENMKADANGNLVFDREMAKNAAQRYLTKAGCRIGNDGYMHDKNGNKLKYTFTVAGDTADHPANALLTFSAEILKSLGCDITVAHDSNALIKLSSGLLTVWAAAWSSSSDPDMYQVYHKNSSATSTLAWGYTYLKSAECIKDDNGVQNNILEDLTELIEKGREVTEVTDRKPYYDDALDKLMELAVEFPTYQRKVYYVWRSETFDTSTMHINDVSAYQSPLSDLWEVGFNEG